MKKIIFVGCVKSSYALLDCLLQHGYCVNGIITMEKSDINSDFQSLKPLAKKYGIDWICTENINGTESINFIKEKKPDLIYCFGWSKLIKQEILEIPTWGVIGFHPTALPANRGRHPLIWALILGLEKTASTFFVMDEGADTGDIISQKEVVIDYFDDAETLYNKVLDKAKAQLLEFTSLLIKGNINRIPQDAESGNTWRKRNKPDGQIDWRMSSRAIYNLVRALTHPYIGAHFLHQNKEIKIWKCIEAKTEKYYNIEPGKVLQVNSPREYFVKAYDGVIHVLDSDDVNLIEGEYL